MQRTVAAEARAGNVNGHLSGWLEFVAAFVEGGGRQAAAPPSPLYSCDRRLARKPVAPATAID
jgi:hypothetical protein